MCDVFKVGVFNLGDFIIQPFDAESTWFGRASGEGMQIKNEVVEAWLEQLFREHM